MVKLRLRENEHISDAVKRFRKLVEHAGISKGTLVTVEAQPFQATTAQHDFFRSFHASMRQGWTGTMEQLAEFLESLRS